MTQSNHPEVTHPRSDVGGRNGSGPHPNEPAAWISGAQWADELGVDPDSGIGEVLGAGAWKAVRAFCRQHEIGLSHFGSDGMAFADFDALPADIWRTAHPKVEVTRGQVAEFADDEMTEDPHEIGERLKRQRSQRFREKDRAEKELKSKGIPRTTLYTLTAVSETAGQQTADRARQLIDQANLYAWSAPNRHKHDEHEYLVSAGELYDRLGVPAELIATMSAATEGDRASALRDLDVARLRYRDEVAHRARTGEADNDEESPLYADIAQLLDDGVPDPPTPDILRRTDGVGLFYRSEINLLYGDPEDGKTMIALAGCAQTLCDGGTALLVDLDDNGVESILSRLLMLGAPETALREGRFRYCSPAGRDQLERAVSDCTAAGQVPDVAVIDCVGELVPLFDGSNNDSDDFTRIIRATAAKLARAGAAVILIDHMAKNSDSRNYGPGGTMAKRRRVGGTQLRVSVEEPLRKGQGGTLVLSIRKDRHSGLRQHCHPTSDKTLQHAGRFIIDHGDTAWCVAIDPLVLDTQHGERIRSLRHRPYLEAAQGLSDSWTITDLARSIHGGKPTPAQRKATDRAVKKMADDGLVEKLSETTEFKSTAYRLISASEDSDND